MDKKQCRDDELFRERFIKPIAKVFAANFYEELEHKKSLMTEEEFEIYCELLRESGFKW